MRYESCPCRRTDGRTLSTRRITRGAIVPEHETATNAAPTRRTGWSALRQLRRTHGLYPVQRTIELVLDFAEMRRQR